MTARSAFRITCLLGFLAVALGAFGAHTLKLRLAEAGMTVTFEKAVLYQFFHVLAMLITTRLKPFPVGAWACFGAGILFFSGSLYVLALTGVTGWGLVTPFGGLAFLAGWVLLAWRGHPED